MADFDYNGDFHKVHNKQKEWLKCLSSASGRVDVQTFSIMNSGNNWHVGPRRFSQHVFYYMIEHEVVGHINHKDIHLKPGDLMWIAPNVDHELWLKDADKSFTMYNFRFKYWHKQRALRFQQDSLIVHDALSLRPYVDLLFDELLHNHPQQNIRLQHILSLLYTDITHQTEDAKQGCFSHRKQIILHRYVVKNCKRRPSVDELAQLVDLSTDYFRRVFKKTFHCAPREWIVRKRIEHSALSLLESPQRSINQTALDYGYDDIYLFSRQFKDVLGMSPSQYRQQH
ncbi:MAG: helix-turn-helix transcriptional regulator [Planctomycetes bacterium]|nr:helix-turn-helix transcriptional regulator [Planctomycetota bacterium]